MEEIRFYPLDINYKIQEGKTYVYLYGRRDSGKRACIKDGSFIPYFFAEAGDVTVLQEIVRGLKVEGRYEVVRALKTEITERIYRGKVRNLLKIYTNTPKQISPLRKELETFPGVKCYEHDVKYTHNYLREKGIILGRQIKVKGELVNERSKVPVWMASEMSLDESESIKDPRILSFDIETYNKEGKVMIPERNPILMVAFYGMDGEVPFKKVITWKKFETKKNYIEFVEDEGILIKRFKQVIEEYKPDILTGYFTDGFDFPYLEVRAKKQRISLDINLDYSSLNFGKEGTGVLIRGISHVDIFQFIRNVYSKGLETNTLDLNSVASEILNEGKKDVDLDNLAKVWDEKPEELEEFCEYNLHDAYVTYELCLKLMPEMLELVKLIGLPISEVTRMPFSRLVENYILRRAKETNVLAANRPAYDEIKERRTKTYKGAYVVEPKPGLYDNLVVFDFRSLYPTIIAAHNVGLDTLRCECCEGKDVVPELGYWYCKEKKGFLPLVIEGLISRRLRVKEMMKGNKDELLKARSMALKYLANSFYGYLGFFAARWYCWECAQSVTAYARDYIQRTMSKAEERGFEVVYGDTDSLFVKLNDKSVEDAKEFMEEINIDLPGQMELEYEGFFPKGIFVALKSREGGAKKKYALLSDKGDIKITGFEFVRRNWSEIAKSVQERVLNQILREGDVEGAFDYVKKIIKKLRSKEVEIDKVMIHTQLQKPLEEYDAIGPHVKVARDMLAKGYEVREGMVVEYVICEGKGLVRDRAKMISEVKEGDYDAEYYIGHQIIPAVSSIFAVLGYNEEDLVSESSQKGLGDFF